MKSLQMYRNLFANIIKIRKSGRFFSNMAGQGWNIAGNLITFAQLKRRMSMNLKALLEPVGTFAWWRSMFAIVLGCLIMAVGYSYFVSPYNIVPGGVYVGKNSSRPASVVFLCRRRRNYARSRVQAPQTRAQRSGSRLRAFQKFIFETLSF